MIKKFCDDCPITSNRYNVYYNEQQTLKCNLEMNGNNHRGSFSIKFTSFTHSNRHTFINFFCKTQLLPLTNTIESTPCITNRSTINNSTSSAANPDLLKMNTKIQ